MASSSSSSSVKSNMRYPFIPDYMQESLLNVYKTEEEIAIEERGKRRGIHGNSRPLQETERRQAQEQLLNTIRQTVESTERALNAATFATASAPVPIPEAERPKSIREVWSGTSNPPIMVLSSQASALDGRPTQEARTCFKIKEKVDYFFRTEFQRPPVLNTNQLMKTLMEDSFSPNESFWDADQGFVIIGQWDKRYFNSVFNSEDILTHEFGHAVTTYSADFTYIGQSGALNESISDIFAIMHKHRLANVNADSPDASWEIAEGFLKNFDEGETTSPLRSMKEPGKAFTNHPIFGDDLQILHTDGINKKIWTDKRDCGGVHVYSGIPNRAFYLMAYEIGGGSWDKCGQIWFRSLLKAEEDDDFTTFATWTVTEAKAYNEGIEHIVQKAWSDVGVNPRRTRARHK